MLIIGDVHGCIKTFEKLLEECKEETEIYTVGDLIDRGPDSRACIQLCIDREIKSVMGNHEHMFLDWLNSGGIYQDGLFMMNGGDKTIRSYTDDNSIPVEHRTYLNAMPLYIETDLCVITHAGAPYGCNSVDDIEKQPLDDGVLWHRGLVIDIGKQQIHGHTPNNKPRENPSSKSINIDTGCAYPQYGELSGVVLNCDEPIRTVTINRVDK